MAGVFHKFKQLSINLEAKPGELTDPKAISVPSPSSDEDVAIFKLTYINKCRDRTSEPSVE